MAKGACCRIPPNIWARFKAVPSSQSGMKLKWRGNYKETVTNVDRVCASLAFLLAQFSCWFQTCLTQLAVATAEEAGWQSIPQERVKLERGWEGRGRERWRSGRFRWAAGVNRLFFSTAAAARFYSVMKGRIARRRCLRFFSWKRKIAKKKAVCVC